jgi:TonB family protein
VSPREPRLSRPARALLTLVLPAERREEFIGDLLEEAGLRQERHGDHAARRWLWSQIVRSWPNLAVARLRRARVPAAAATMSGGQVVLLGGSRLVPRSLAVVVSILLHVALFGVLAVRGVWTVEELSGPSVVVTFWSGFMPQAAPTFTEPKPAPRPRPTKSTGPVSARAAAVPITMAPPTAVERRGGGEDTGDPSTEGPPGPPCPPGGDCSATEPTPAARMLPPKVGEKSCLACAEPHLPPAYLSVGMTYVVLVKICVNNEGEVESAQVLKGLGGAADDSVVMTVLGWRFRPYAIDGRPVPFCYATRFVFSAR